MGLATGPDDPEAATVEHDLAQSGVGVGDDCRSIDRQPQENVEQLREGAPVADEQERHGRAGTRASSAGIDTSPRGAGAGGPFHGGLQLILPWRKVAGGLDFALEPERPPAQDAREWLAEHVKKVQEELGHPSVGVDEALRQECVQTRGGRATEEATSWRPRLG